MQRFDNLNKIIHKPIEKIYLVEKEYNDFLLLGMGIHMKVLDFSRSNEIPSFDMMCPNNFPFETSEILFFGLGEMSYFWHLSKIRFKLYK